MGSSRKYYRDPLLWILLAGLCCSAAFKQEWSFGIESWFAAETEYDSKGVLGTVNFSESGGPREEGFSLELSSSNPSSTTAIFYTLDGSLPTRQSHRYDGPVSIAAGISESQIDRVSTGIRWKPSIGKQPEVVVVRAAADHGHLGFSAVETQTYILNNPHQFPVVSLCMEPEDLVGNGDGIYVMGNALLRQETQEAVEGKHRIEWWDMPANYHQRGKRWERRCHLEFFDEQGEQVMHTGAGLRINGNATRSFPQKSLRVYARGIYGVAEFQYPLFGEEGAQRFRNFILRNGGNDWDRAMMRDLVCHAMMAGTDVAVQESRSVVVYINGKYWGLHHLRPRLNEDHVAILNGVEVEDLIMLEKNSEIYHGNTGDEQQFLQLLQFAEQEGLENAANYQKVESSVNIPAFIDYLWAEIYSVNTDWPANNVKYYRLRSEGSKWQWLLMDTDYGFGYTYPESWETNMFRHIEKSGTHLGRLYLALMKNASFKRQFFARGEQLMETHFTPARMIGLIDGIEASIEEEMGRQVKRWRKPRDLNHWKEEVEILRQFVKNRSGVLQSQIEQLKAK